MTERLLLAKAALMLFGYAGEGVEVDGYGDPMDLHVEIGTHLFGAVFVDLDDPEWELKREIERATRPVPNATGEGR